MDFKLSSLSIHVSLFVSRMDLGELHQSLPLQVAFAPQELDELQGCDFKASKMSYHVTVMSYKSVYNFAGLYGNELRLHPFRSSSLRSSLNTKLIMGIF